MRAIVIFILPGRNAEKCQPAINVPKTLQTHAEPIAEATLPFWTWFIENPRLPQG
ncbi:MAG: hypothetical protein ABI883_00450 [Chthoniobacterales bacterium]